MQLYLCEKYDKDHKISFPYDSDEYWETLEWLVWMVSLLKIHLFFPKSHPKHQQTDPTFSNNSKAALDQCKGKPTIFSVVSIAVISDFLSSWGLVWECQN
jgi:hypothetical protein